MIVSRTPFRISLGGGGTDLPAYYSKHGGFFVAGAVDKYMHIVLNDRFEPGIRLSYSRTEIVDAVEQIRHPSVREALKLVGVGDRIEIVSLADVPAATGLGSSGSFTVGLLNALYARQRVVKSPDEVAEAACDIAMNRLREPSGKQDEYAASLGGIRSYEIDRDGRVTSKELKIPENTLSELEYGMMMFYTGITRSAGEILGKQQAKVSEGDDDALRKMHAIKAIGMESKEALESSDLKRFGELLHEHWVLKRGITESMSTDSVDSWYASARENGALGGKLVGAGGGGFLMLFCQEGRERVRAALARRGLVEMRFRFDPQGSKVIYNV
ncbi:MAG: galactokinase [Nitrososphaerota archaeon]|nr:galactokinase [Nitrososphaerota archaeon]MDG6978477.1 galactokinase [Nitrososphaerota archaeon]